MRLSKTYQAILGEFIGTFLLLFVGCGAILIQEETAFKIGDFGIGLAFGGIVALAILFLNRLSFVHLNPIVTLVAFLQGKMNKKELRHYLISQGFGAMAAVLVLGILFPHSANLGSTLPKSGLVTTFILEFFLTFVLVGVILFTAHKSIITQAFFIGTTIFLEAFLFGPFTGASMNPIRSFAPMLMSHNMIYFPIYLVSCMAGGLFAFRLLTVKQSLKST